MPLYHNHVKIFSRKLGESAVAAAAYRSASVFLDERTGIAHDFDRKRGVYDTIIMAPDDAPEWVYDRDLLWNAVEKFENRRDSQLAREIELALPVELDHKTKIELTKKYIADTFVSEGMIADMCFHDFDSHNPHVHVMLTMRDITDTGFGQKNRSWNPGFANTKGSSKGFVSDSSPLVEVREKWADYLNRSLAENYVDARVDHRSLKDQGIDRIPTIHVGRKVVEMTKRGIPTDRADRMRNIVKVKKMAAQLSDINKEIEEAMSAAMPDDVFEKMPESMFEVNEIPSNIPTAYAYPDKKIIDKMIASEPETKKSNTFIKSVEDVTPKSIYDGKLYYPISKLDQGDRSRLAEGHRRLSEKKINSAFEKSLNDDVVKEIESHADRWERKQKLLDELEGLLGLDRTLKYMHRVYDNKAKNILKPPLGLRLLNASNRKKKEGEKKKKSPWMSAEVEAAVKFVRAILTKWFGDYRNAHLHRAPKNPPSKPKR